MFLISWARVRARIRAEARARAQAKARASVEVGTKAMARVGGWGLPNEVEVQMVEIMNC